MSSIALPDVRSRSEQEIKAEAGPAQVMEASRIDPSIVSTTHAGLVQRLGHLGESFSYIEKHDMVTRMYAIHWEVRHGRSCQTDLWGCGSYAGSNGFTRRSVVMILTSCEQYRYRALDEGPWTGGPGIGISG